MRVTVVHSYESLLMYEDNLWFQGLKYCGLFFSGVIFRYHILTNLCTCDSSLRSLYLSYIVSVVRRCVHKIIVQSK